MPIDPITGLLIAQGVVQHGPGIARSIGGGIKRGADYTGLTEGLRGLGQNAQGQKNWFGKLGGFANAVFNPEEEITPERQAQQEYLQRVRQPFQLGTAARQQEILRNFNQNILPGIRNQFTAGNVGQRSSAFEQGVGEGERDLQYMLAALGEQNALQEEQMNQGRMGQLGGYLGGQQDLAMRAQEVGQRGTIAQQNANLQRMLQMGNYDIAGQGQVSNRMDAYARAMGGLGNQAQGLQFDTKHFPGQPAGYEELVRKFGPTAARAMALMLGMPTN